jgi:hypothetical protein
MKQSRCPAWNLCLVFFFSLLSPAVVIAQTPTFNISPNIISNNYVGPVTLTIGNLPTGQKMDIGVYLDANSNGHIDSNEYEVQHFAVTDGAQSILGGATNINVPGDTDGTANGQITTVLNYPGLNGTLAHIAGNYLFKLSDPNHVLSAVTNSFTVLQQSSSQGVSGTVYANNQPLTNAVVVLVSPNGNGGAGAVADANGHFTINYLPGDYDMVAADPGYVGTLAPVTVTSNSFAAVNLTNVTATGVLAGTVADISTSNGIPGIFVTAQGGSVLTLGFTDTNGNFSLPAVPNRWKIQFDTTSGLGAAAPYGYVTFQNTQFTTNLASGSISNLNFSFPRAAALIYGQLTDNHSNAIPATIIDASSEDNLYDAKGETDVNGNYAIGVFSNSWFVGPDELPANYLVGTTNVPIVNGQSFLQNLQAQLVTAYVTGKVVDGNGNPQTNIMLVVNSVVSNYGLVPLNQNYTTASDGTFSIGLYGGTWNLAPECDSAGTSGLVPPNINLTVVDGVNQSNILLIEPLATVTISGSVTDKNGNPVDAIAFASATIDGTNYSPCAYGNQNTNTYQIAVFPGEWSVGLSGDFTSDGYDVPANQNLNVTGNETLNFILYPLGQTPPQLTNFSRVAGNFEFNLNGDPLQNYCVQVSTNLATWKSLVTNTAYGGSFFFEDTNASGPDRFYRAVLVQ